MTHGPQSEPRRGEAARGETSGSCAVYNTQEAKKQCMVLAVRYTGVTRCMEEQGGATHTHTHCSPK